VQLTGSLRAHGRSLCDLMRRDDVGPNRHGRTPRRSSQPQRRSPRYPLRLARHAGSTQGPEMRGTYRFAGPVLSVCVARRGASSRTEPPANTTQRQRDDQSTMVRTSLAAADRVQQLEDVWATRPRSSDSRPMTVTWPHSHRRATRAPSSWGPPRSSRSEVWESWRMLLPASFPDVPSSDWLVLVTPAYGPPYGGPPPLILEAELAPHAEGQRVRGGVAHAGLSAPSRRGQWTRYNAALRLRNTGLGGVVRRRRPQWLRAPGDSRPRLALNLVNPSNDGGPTPRGLSIY